MLTFCYYQGGFFLSFATTLTPSFNATAAYGTDVEQFHATFGFFPLFMGLLCVFYFICSLRTNIVFATIFFFLVAALGLLTAGHWQIAQGHVDLAANINIVGPLPIIIVQYILRL
jgi:succinate-acetate transporter protein